MADEANIFTIVLFYLIFKSAVNDSWCANLGTDCTFMTGSDAMKYEFHINNLLSNTPRGQLQPLMCIFLIDLKYGINVSMTELKMNRISMFSSYLRSQHIRAQEVFTPLATGTISASAPSASVQGPSINVVRFASVIMSQPHRHRWSSRYVHVHSGVFVEYDR